MRLVKVLPAREKTAEIRELLDLGWPEREIVVKVFGGGEVSPYQTMAVQGVRDDPHGYDTDVDEVAVARALDGDRAVWEGMTHYERREVLLTIAARRDLEGRENDEERALFRKLSSEGAANFKQPHDRIPGWLGLLAERLGFDAKRLHQHARDAAQARVL